MSNEANISVRFSTSQTEVVKKALQEFGEEGQKVLDRLERATGKPSDGMKALNAVMAEGKLTINGLASQAGILGTALSAMSPIGVAVAASLAGIGLAAKSTFETLKVESEKVGALKDVADRIGLTTDALQEMRYAALESGVEQEKLTNSLTRFSLNVGEAAEGTGTLADELRRYHINVVNADKSTRSSEDILRDYANAMKGAHSDQERLRLAIAAFGKDGAAMVNILRDGSEGLDDFKAKAHEAGLVLSQGVLENAKKFNDEIERLEAIKSGALQQALFGDEPPAKAIKDLEDFNKWLGGLEGTVERIWTKYGPGAANFIGGVLSGGVGLAFQASNYLSKKDTSSFDASTMGVIAGLQNWQGKFGANDNAGPLHLTPAEVAKLTEELNKQVLSTDAVAAALEKYQHGLALVNQLVADGSVTAGKAKDYQDKLTDAYNEVTIAAALKATPAHKSVEAALYQQTLENEKLIEAMKISQHEYDVTVQKLKLVKEGFQGTDEQARAYAETLARQDKQIKDQNKTWDDQAAAAKKAAEDAVRAAEATARAIDRLAQDMGANLIDAFINMAEGAERPFDRLLAYAKATFAKMAAEALLNPILVPIISQVVGAIGGGGGAAGVASGAAGVLSGGNAILGLAGLSGANLLNTFGATYLGTGATAGSLAAAGANSVSLSSLSAPLLTSYLGAGALGGLGGYLLADLVGMRSKTNASIGAGAGAMIGLGVGGPVGALAGALIGSLAGLFGARPSDKLQGDWINFAAGTTSTYGYTGNKYSAENAQAAGALASSLVNFGNLLKGVGLNPNFATNARVEAGSQGSPFRIWYGGINGDTSNGMFQDPQSAFKAMAAEILKSLTDVPQNLQKVIDQIDYSNLDDFAQKLQDALAWTQTVQGVKDQLQQMKDPKGYELKMLDDLFNPLKEKARETGEGLAEIEELYGIRRKDILDRYAGASVAPATFNLGDAWTNMNAAEGRGFLNDINAAVGAHTTGLAAAGSNATGVEWVNRTFTGSLRNIIGNGNLTVDQLSVIKATFASIPEVIASVNQALEDLTAKANPAADAVARLPALLQEAAQAQIEAVSQQIDSAKTLQSFFQNASVNFRQAAVGLDFNQSTSALNVSGQFDLAQSIFEADRSKALLGDQDAISRVIDEGNQFAAIAKQMFGSTSQFVSIQQRVKDTFIKVADLSDRQADIASQSLTVAQQSLEQLKKIAASGTVIAAARSYSAADLDALTSAFGAAYNAGQAPVGSTTFDFFKTQLLTEIGGLSDVSRLKSDFVGQVGRVGSSDPTAVAAPDILRAIAVRLSNLGQGGDAAVIAALGQLDVATGADIRALAGEIRNLLARVPRAA